MTARVILDQLIKMAMSAPCVCLQSVTAPADSCKVEKEDEGYLYKSSSIGQYLRMEPGPSESATPVTNCAPAMITCKPLLYCVNPLVHAATSAVNSTGECVCKGGGMPFLPDSDLGNPWLVRLFQNVAMTRFASEACTTKCSNDGLFGANSTNYVDEKMDVKMDFASESPVNDDPSHASSTDYKDEHFDLKMESNLGCNSEASRLLSCNTQVNFESEQKAGSSVFGVVSYKSEPHSFESLDDVQGDSAVSSNAETTDDFDILHGDEAKTVNQPMEKSFVLKKSPNSEFLMSYSTFLQQHDAEDNPKVTEHFVKRSEQSDQLRFGCRPTLQQSSKDKKRKRGINTRYPEITKRHNSTSHFLTSAVAENQNVTVADAENKTITEACTKKQIVIEVISSDDDSQPPTLQDGSKPVVHTITEACTKKQIVFEVISSDDDSQPPTLQDGSKPVVNAPSDTVVYSIAHAGPGILKSTANSTSGCVGENLVPLVVGSFVGDLKPASVMANLLEQEQPSKERSLGPQRSLQPMRAQRCIATGECEDVGMPQKSGSGQITSDDKGEDVQTHHTSTKLDVHTQHTCVKCDVSWKCAVCERTFPLPTQLSEHIITHMYEDRYYCDVCFQFFPQFSVLELHMITHRAILLQDD